jgi:S1-C subfamily serine protease
MEEPTAKHPKTNAKSSAQRKESDGKTDARMKYYQKKAVDDTRKSESISLIVRKNGFYGSRAKNGKGQILVREVHPDHVGDIREGDILVSLNGVDVSGHTNQQFQQGYSDNHDG